MALGHGPVIKERSLERIEEYIAHRQAREDEIYSVLQEAFLMHKFDVKNKTHEDKMEIKIKNKTPIFNPEYEYFEDLNSEFRTSWEVMTKVYGSLPVFVKFSAQKNCLHHLEKMLKEKKVDFLKPDFWKLNDSVR
jgi:Beta-lactamase associated winged helix domain